MTLMQLRLLLASMNTGLWNLYGIEMDSATAVVLWLHSGAKVFVGDIMNALFVPNSFDKSCAFDVPEHMYQPQQMLEQVVCGCDRRYLCESAQH